MPPQLTFVPIDFNADDLAQMLFQNGFFSTERALFIWEGVTYYLTVEAVDHTLAAVKAVSAAGSDICFDHASLLPEALSEEGARVLREHMRTKHSNEPTRFGIPYGTLNQFLVERGYQIVENLNASEMENRYLTLRDGSVAGKVPNLFPLVRAAISG
jgi:methyltransferase (TIGR00027 family)